MKLIAKALVPIVLIATVELSTAQPLSNRDDPSSIIGPNLSRNLFQISENRSLSLDRLERRFREFDPQYNHGPNHPFTNYNFAHFNCRKDRLDRAVLFLNQAIETAPNFTEAYHYRGLIHFAERRLEEAISDLDKVLEHDPDTFLANHYRDQAWNCLHKKLQCKVYWMEICDWAYRFGRGRVIKGPPGFLHNRGPYLPKLGLPKQD